MPVSFQMVVTVKGLHLQNQRIRHMKKMGTIIRKNKGNGKSGKGSGRNTTNSCSKKKKGEEEVRIVYNEGYYTDNINSDSLHQESEYQDITDDDNYQKNKKKKPNKKEDWSDKALEDFLETLREQPVRDEW